jgi:hypothetical protein
MSALFLASRPDISIGTIWNFCGILNADSNPHEKGTPPKAMWFGKIQTMEMRLIADLVHVTGEETMPRLYDALSV